MSRIHTPFTNSAVHELGGGPGSSPAHGALDTVVRTWTAWYETRASVAAWRIGSRGVRAAGQGPRRSSRARRSPL